MVRLILIDEFVLKNKKTGKKAIGMNIKQFEIPDEALKEVEKKLKK